VLDEVCFGPENLLLPVDAVLARAGAALRTVGLWDRRGHDPATLSGGGRQRLAIACALALGSPLLVLDEPTANLDPGATREVERIVDRIHASGTKIVMTTHNLGQARRLADEILFMSAGKLTDHAPVQRFFAQPSTAEAAAFIKGELPWS
jgi:energy-coupling factor transporter ATP-binding protein EcfA2